MSVMQEILVWTKSLPSWQSDAVSRLLTKQSLDVGDIDDLFALLKSAHGIYDPKGRVPRPLSSDQIPVHVPNERRIYLRAIKNMRNVNAIAKNQRLSFCESGLTVVYGDNGSGKSGYSRVLKRACRARDQNEKIYPNAKLSASEGAPEAEFDINVDGFEKTVKWVYEKEAPSELSSFAVFDTRCARIYLDDEGGFSYVPYGLHLFKELSEILRKLEDCVKNERLRYSVDRSVFKSLEGDTEVGRLVSALSAKTDLGKVDELINLTDEELTQRTELEKFLKEGNPKDKAEQIRLKSLRISSIAKKLEEASGLVCQSVVDKLIELSSTYRSAKSAAEMAAKDFNEKGGLLPGTGGEGWRTLFEAARKFALDAYPEKTFPYLGIGALCPLCQQPLIDGEARLRHFEEFIKQEAEVLSQKCRRNLYEAYKSIEDNSVRLDIDAAIYEEIDALDPGLSREIKDFESELVRRREAILSSVKSNEWGGLDSFALDPLPRIKGIISRMREEVDSLEKLSDEKTRNILQKRFMELDARFRMCQFESPLKEAVKKFRHQSSLDKCLSAVKTTEISKKSREFSERLISEDLKEALNKEFRGLGVDELSVSIKSRSERGKWLHKLKMDFQGSYSPGDILSEGEQRAVAIGSFLAEVNLSGGSGGVIFDDPVSSLDHRRRGFVAKRLVSEAKKRQVIVFTHDIYFLCILMEEASNSQVECFTQSLRRTSGGFGVADSGLPFEGMSVKKRIGALRSMQQSIRKLSLDGEEQECRRKTIEAYCKLRMTWERAVEEVLLRGVVIRFRKGVETQRLSGVVVCDSDYFSVSKGMSKCSNYAHDRAFMGDIDVPSPEELLGDIEALEKWRIQVEDRAESVIRSRKQ